MSGESELLDANKAKMSKIFRDFYILTHTRIVLFDSSFCEIMSYPDTRCEFCTILRDTSEGEALCAKSDQDGCRQCERTKELVVYRCHAGLTEVVAPISDSNGILGYIMFGQILCDKDLGRAREHIKKKFSDSKYRGITDSVDRILHKTNDEITATATVLQALTEYVLFSKYVVPSKTEFVRKLDDYLMKNIDRNISVEELCDEFRMGRTKLYKTANMYLGCGLAQYIRNSKIAHAKHLLRETNLAIKDVSDRVGISDYNSFSRLFKQKTGVTARDWRNNHRNKNYRKEALL